MPRRTSQASRSLFLASRGASSGSIGPRNAWNADGVEAGIHARDHGDALGWLNRLLARMSGLMDHLAVGIMLVVI